MPSNHHGETCISPILSYSGSSEKRSNRHGHSDSNNPCLAKPSWYPKVVSLDLSVQHYCSYRSVISAYNEAFGSFTVGKHPHITNLMTGIFNNGRNLKDYAFPPNLSYSNNSEKSSNRHGHNNSNIPSLAKPILLPQSCFLRC